jgi:hypothetical protein
MHYNFAGTNQTIRCAPAMAAGVSGHQWTIEEIVMLIETQNGRAVA